MNKLTLLTLVLVLTGMVVVGPPSMSKAQEGSKLLRFESTDCRFDVPENAGVFCGDVAVPLNRSEADSPVIRLHVAVFPSLSATPASDPLVYLDTEPGRATLDTVPLLYETLILPHLAYRDVVLFDYRASGHSEPVLSCLAIEPMFLPQRDDARTVAERNEATLMAYSDCAARLAPLDLNAINSLETASDFCGCAPRELKTNLKEGYRSRCR